MIKLGQDWNSPMSGFLSTLGLEDKIIEGNLSKIQIPTSISPRLPPPPTLVKLEISTMKEVQTFFRGMKEDDILKSGNTPVVLYIKWSRMINSSTATSGLPRLHLVNCSKLREMREAGRINRYVATSEIHGVYDLLGGSGKNPFQRSLMVCQACLTSIRREHPNAPSDFGLFKPSNQIDLSGWFSLSPGAIPHANLFSTPTLVTSGGYTTDWPIISQAKRTSAGWKCSGCKLDLSNRKDLLDTHHVDGNPQNNTASNLTVLCRVCHSNQPMHQHMRESSEWKGQYNTISRLRVHQGIFL
jgi:hypothetical protein